MRGFAKLSKARASVPSSRPKERLRDIICNIDRAFAHVEGYDFARYREDRKTIDAIERCFSRICEAAHRLGKEHHDTLPEIDWRRMQDFGNLLRHEYERGSEELVWGYLTHDLPPLRDHCQEALKRLGERGEVEDEG